jgi:alpha-L-fucosidase
MRKKTISRRRFVKAGLALMAGARRARLALAKPVGPTQEPIASGPFQPTWESLQQYETPEWFRDAKFGLWAHWSPQCVPEDGDWYARNMYIQGSPQYRYHVEHYGHPSRFGYKDICNLWKAEKWEPDQLIQLYKRVGAKYFVALANHHCNFDGWDSKYQPWNSVQIGPKKDLIGIWGQTARKHGLRFGVTVHSARSWNWFEVSRDSDKDGPTKGVSYDGVLTKADGQGKWWDGYDPADLYCRPHEPKSKPDQEYIDKWFTRTKDLIDQYHPDLLYFDDSRLPLGDAGLKIAAHYYNSNMQLHGGKLEAVLNTKNMPSELRKTLVWDIERGRTDRLEPYPWQTDTCIGNWHYKRGIQYKTAAIVVPVLVDNVSKNGNLLLNIPLKGDGSIDDDEVKFLEDMAQWMKVNGEAIYGTRPWKIYGEGAPEFQGGSASFNENKVRPYTAEDIRFTTKGDTLYAVALGWPASGKLTIKSLAANAPHFQTKIGAMELLGSGAKLQWTRDENGLTISLPAEKPCDHAFVFKIKPA